MFTALGSRNRLQSRAGILKHWTVSQATPTSQPFIITDAHGNQLLEPRENGEKHWGNKRFCKVCLDFLSQRTIAFSS